MQHGYWEPALFDSRERSFARHHMLMYKRLYVEELLEQYFALKRLGLAIGKVF